MLCFFARRSRSTLTLAARTASAVLSPWRKPGFVQGSHPGARGLIVNRPEAHDHRSRAGDLKRPAQTEHAFARPDLSEPGIARREHRPFDAVEIQRGHFLRGQDPIVLVEADGATAIGAGQGQTRQEERVLAAFLGEARGSGRRRRRASAGAGRRRTRLADEEAMRGEMHDAPAGNRLLDRGLAGGWPAQHGDEARSG